GLLARGIDPERLLPGRDGAPVVAVVVEAGGLDEQFLQEFVVDHQSPAGATPPGYPPVKSWPNVGSGTGKSNGGKAREKRRIPRRRRTDQAGFRARRTSSLRSASPG